MYNDKKHKSLKLVLNKKNRGPRKSLTEWILWGNEKAKCQCDILRFLNKKHKSLKLVLSSGGAPRGGECVKKIACGKFLAYEREQSVIAVRLRQEANPWVRTQI